MDNFICKKCNFQNETGSEACSQCGNSLTQSYTYQQGESADIFKGSRLLNGRYKQIKTLARTKITTVSQAIDSHTGKTVVLKEYENKLTGGDSINTVTAKFNELLPVLCKLRHPGISQVSDYFIEDGKYYVVSDLIQGNNLKKIVSDRNNKPFDEDYIINLTFQILDIFKYLHGQDPPYYYRAFKPTNLMIDENNRIYLVDFDIDRIFYKEEETRDRNPFDAPEEKIGAISPRTDIFGLGAIMRFLFTGIDPTDRTKYAHFKRIKDVNNNISPWLDELILSMTAINLEERPKTYTDVISIINEHLTKNPQPAVPKSTPHPAPNGPVTVLKPQVVAKAVVTSRPSAKVDQDAKIFKSCAVIFLIIALVVIAAAWLAGPVILSNNYYNQGLAAYQRQDYKKACELFETQLKMKKTAEGFLGLGNSRFMLGEYDKALEAYDNAIKISPGMKDLINPRKIDVYMKNASGAFSNNDIKEMEKYLDLAAKVDPENAMFKEPQPAITSGKEKLKAGNYPEALFDFNRALMIDKNNKEALFGRILCTLRLKGPNEVQAELKTFLKNNPQADKIMPDMPANIVSDLVSSAREFANAKRYEDALKYYSIILLISPKNCQVLYDRANLYLRMKEKKLAINDLELIKDKDKDGSWSDCAKAKIEQIKSGDYSASIPVPTPTPEITPTRSQERIKLRNRTRRPITSQPLKPSGSYNKRFQILGGNGSTGYVAKDSSNKIMLLKGSYYLDQNRSYPGNYSGEDVYIESGGYNGPAKFMKYKLDTVTVVGVTKPAPPPAYTRPQPTPYSYSGSQQGSYNNQSTRPGAYNTPYSSRPNSYGSTSPRGYSTPYKPRPPQQYVNNNSSYDNNYNSGSSSSYNNRSSYNNTYRITFRKNDGSLIVVEDYSLGREVSYGQQFYATFEFNNIILYNPARYYSSSKYKISGSGSIQ